VILPTGTLIWGCERERVQEKGGTKKIGARKRGARNWYSIGRIVGEMLSEWG